MSHPPSANPPSLQRTIAYVALVAQLAVLAHLGVDAINHVPDSYAHEHLTLLLGNVGSGFLILALLSDRSSRRTWLLALSTILIGADLAASLLR